MATEPGDTGPAKGAPEVANLGVLRPPLVYLASIVTGLAIHMAWPLPFFPGVPAGPLGSSLIVVSILLFAASVKTFRAAGTPGSWWLIVTLVGAVAIIHFVVIPREERYLEGRFSAEYLDYKASVRRWL